MTLAVVALAALLPVVLAWHALAERRWAAERRSLIHAVLARTPAEYAALEDRPPRDAREERRRDPAERPGAGLIGA